MNQYIITEEQIISIDGTSNDEIIFNEVRSHPYNPQAEQKGQRCIHCEVRNDVQFCHYHDAPIYNPQAEREKVLDELREIKKYDRIRFHQKHTLPKSWTDAKVIGVFKNGKRIGISAVLPGSRCTTEMTIDLSDVRYVCRWIELREGKDGE